jgi:hypothetical protein
VGFESGIATTQGEAVMENELFVSLASSARRLARVD